MAVPKKRTSKAKKNKRKFVWKNKILKRCLIIPVHDQMSEDIFEPREDNEEAQVRGFNPNPLPVTDEKTKQKRKKKKKRNRNKRRSETSS